MQVGKGTDKNRGSQHQQQGKSNLSHDKELTQADAPSVPAGGAGASLFKRWSDIHARGFNGRCKPKQDSCGTCDRDCESEDAPVQFRAKTEILAATSEQPDQETNPCGCNAHAQDASRQRE